MQIGAKVDERKTIEADLGQTVSDLVWLKMLAEYLNDDYLSGALTIDELRDQIARLTRRSSRRHPDDPLPLFESTINRSRVLAKLYAKLASESDDDLQALREKLRPCPTLRNFIKWLHAEYQKEQTAFDLDERTVELPYMNGRSEAALRVKPTSLLGQLAMMVARLAKAFPWNRSKIARWIVCEGSPPPVVSAVVSTDLVGTTSFGPFRAPTDTLTRITITVDPSLSPEEVMAIYAQARAGIRPSSKARLRLLTDKSLALADFVLDREADVDLNPPWEEWRAIWNSNVSQLDVDWKYDLSKANSPANFKRDAKSAISRLARVGWADSMHDDWNKMEEQ
jgi:hypothetical protein